MRAVFYVLLFCILFIYFCGRKNKIKLDDFTFYAPAEFELVLEPNDENVLLTLNNPNGNAIIIQENLNILKTTLFKHINDAETLKSMHMLKFNSFIELMKGYDIEQVRLDKIGEIPFSLQSFKCQKEDVELAYDIRIIQVGNNYYGFYCFGESENEKKNLKITNNIIRSLFC
jgi:hypothetical protein